MLVLSLAAAVIVAANVNAISAVHPSDALVQSDSSRNAMLLGNVHYLLLSDQAWRTFSRFTDVMYPARYFDWTAILLTGLTGAGVIAILRKKLCWNWTSIGLSLLLTSSIPYLAGRIALHDNTVLEASGPWITTMLLGMLYSLIGCTSCAIAGLRSSDQVAAVR